MSQNDESFDESFEEDFDEDFEEDFEEFEEDDDALNALGMNYRMIHIQPMTQKNLQWKEFIKKKKERIHELQKFIHLSSTSIHTLLEIPPKTEYEIYKQSNKYKQSSIQYPSMESKCDVNIQTNELEYINHSTQSPDDIGLYTKANHHIHDCRNKNISMDSLKLLKFIRNTSMIFESLIKREESNETCNFIFSQSYRKFYHEEIQNNPLHEVLWNKFDPHYLLCNYSNHDKGYLIVYHMKLGYTKHLICNSMITSSIFLSSHLVLCGTKDGSLQLWDLSETDSLHKDLYRYPTYSTDWLIYENHKSPICNIVLLNDKESIQIASLDENGVLQYWIVVHTNDEIHEYDCGKSLFGKMKLLKTGENHLNTKCTTLEYKNHRFLIGTDHKIINGFKMYPKEYLTNHYINQIKFNPFKEYFLVVYNDNTIGYGTFF